MEDDNWEPHFALSDEEKLAHCREVHLGARDSIIEERDEAIAEAERYTLLYEDAYADKCEMKRSAKGLQKDMAQVLIDISKLRSNLIFADNSESTMKQFEKIEGQLSEVNRKLGKDF